MKFGTILIIIIIILALLYWKAPTTFNMIKDNSFSMFNKLWDYSKDKIENYNSQNANSTLNKLGYPKCTTDDNCKTLSECQNKICICNLNDGICYS